MKSKRIRFTVLAMVICVSILLFPFPFVKAQTSTKETTSNIMKLSLNASNLILNLEESYILTAEIKPQSSGKHRDIIWTSSDDTIVTVVNGTIYAAGVGAAIVFANCDTNIAFCKVSVVRYNPVLAVQKKNFKGYSGTDLEVVKKAAEVVDKNILPGMTEEQKAKAIFEYLIANCIYDHREKKDVPQSAYGIIGPLLKNNGIDEGFSYTFKYFMDILGIECRMMHIYNSYMTNQVFLNEKWHIVGIPWDKPIAGFGTSDYKVESIVTPIQNEYRNATIWREVNYESILKDYREDAYSGNEAAVIKSSSENSNTKENNITEKAEEYTVILDTNFSYSKHFSLDGEATTIETIKDKQKYAPQILPVVKGSNNIYISSFNTKADGTGISYPDRTVTNVSENLYLYCIWTVDIKQTEITLKRGKNSFTAKWSKAGSKEYQLRYSTNSTMKNAVIKSVSGQQIQVAGLKNKTNYYVQVRGYIKDDKGNIIYGKWSTRKTVKTD